MTKDAKRKDKEACRRAEGDRRKSEKPKGPLEEPGREINPEQNNNPN